MKVFIRLLKNPTSLAGIILLLAYVVVAVAAPVFAPIPPNSRDPYMIPREGFANEPKPPDEKHLFGTTEGQYDIFYGVIWGTRTAFRVGVVITFVTVIVGLLIGSLAGFYGRCRAPLSLLQIQNCCCNRPDRRATARNPSQN